MQTQSSLIVSIVGTLRKTSAHIRTHAFIEQTKMHSMAKPLMNSIRSTTIVSIIICLLCARGCSKRVSNAQTNKPRVYDVLRRLPQHYDDAIDHSHLFSYFTRRFRFQSHLRARRKDERESDDSSAICTEQHNRQCMGFVQFCVSTR